MILRKILLEGSLDGSTVDGVLESPFASGAAALGTDALDSPECRLDDGLFLGILALALDDGDAEGDVSVSLLSDGHPGLEELDEGRTSGVSGQLFVVLLDVEEGLLGLHRVVESSLDDLGAVPVHHLDGTNDGVESIRVLGIEGRFEALEGNIVCVHLEDDDGSVGICRRILLGIGVDRNIGGIRVVGHDGLGGLRQVTHVN